MSDEDSGDTLYDDSGEDFNDTSLDSTPDSSTDFSSDGSDMAGESFDLSSDEGVSSDDGYNDGDSSLDEALQEDGSGMLDETMLSEDVSEENLEEIPTDEPIMEEPPEDDELTEEVAAEEERLSEEMAEEEHDAEVEADATEEQIVGALDDAEKQEEAMSATGDNAEQLSDDATAAAKEAEAAAERLKDIDVSDQEAVEAAVTEAQDKGTEAQRLSSAAEDASDAAASTSEAAREISDQTADTVSEQAKEAEKASEDAEYAAREADEESKRSQEEAEQTEAEALREQEEQEQAAREAQEQEAEALREQEEQEQAESNSTTEISGEESAVFLEEATTGDSEISMDHTDDSAASIDDSSSDKDAIYADRFLEETRLSPEERIEGYREEIGHNDLADIEAARELQNADVMGETGSTVNTADNLLDAIDAYGSQKMADSQMEANNEMADKMTEYTISQGHNADYTEDYNEVSSSEASDVSQPDVSEEEDITDEPIDQTEAAEAEPMDVEDQTTTDISEETQQEEKEETTSREERELEDEESGLEEGTADGESSDAQTEGEDNGKFETFSGQSEEYDSPDMFMGVGAVNANKLHDAMIDAGYSESDALNAALSGNDVREVRLEKGEELARVEDSDYRFNENSPYYTTDDELQSQGVMDESGAVNEDVAKEKYALPEFARNEEGAVIGDRSVDVVSHRVVNEPTTAYISDVAPARDSDGVKSFERVGGAKQIIIPDTSKLSDYKEASKEADTTGKR